MRLWRNLVGRTTLRAWAFGRESSNLSSRTLYEVGRCSADLSVKQAALNIAVDAEWFNSSISHFGDCGWCRSRFHKPACQIRFLKSLFEREMQPIRPMAGHDHDTVETVVRFDYRLLAGE